MRPFFEIGVAMPWGGVLRGLRSQPQSHRQPPQKQNLLFLHGWLDNSHSFLPLLHQLTNNNNSINNNSINNSINSDFDTDFDIVAIDFAGSGQSSHRPKGVLYHHIDNVIDVMHVAEGLGWDRFSIVGHSMGAGVASMVAGAWPAR